jgi:hypothetical protein
MIGSLKIRTLFDPIATAMTRLLYREPHTISQADKGASEKGK